MFVGGSGGLLRGGVWRGRALGVGWVGGYCCVYEATRR
jgi:hypothetical protein